MPPRPTPLEISVEALRHLPVGDLAAHDHVRTLRARLAVASETELLSFFRLLDTLDIDQTNVQPHLEQAQSSADPTQKRVALSWLRRHLEPARDIVLRHLAAPPGDLGLIVDLRAKLLAFLDKGPDAAGLSLLDADLRSFLATQVDIGLLEMRRLTWSDSAALLERLARSEAVHAIRGWFDLKDRLDEDRRVYAFFHPALPGMPVVFTEVALTDEMPTSIRAILNPNAPRVDAASARCATFYSISNTEPGLTGIPFGNALIKHAMAQLRADLPRLRTFATLSPLPGFADWLRTLGERVDAAVRATLAVPGWHRNPTALGMLREPLLRLAARYLVEIKRSDGAPRDAVARFHIGNGAMVERLDFLADPSPRGIEQSFGVMVNYRYVPDRYGANQVAYATNFAVDVASAVRALAAADPTLIGESPAPVARVNVVATWLRGAIVRAKRIVLREAAGANAG